MFGIRFIKAQPTTYLMQYSRGRLKRQGRGLAFFYYAPFTDLVAVPMESVDIPFVFHQLTADFQEVTIQGQVTYRIMDAQQVAELLNFTLSQDGKEYLTEDPQQLPNRVIHVIQVLMQASLNHLSLRDSLRKAAVLVQQVSEGLNNSKEIKTLGLEILGLSILAIKATPETARALEADVREKLLKEADEAIYDRRNAAVEQERAIKENELNTEIAVENKKREIQETQMEAKQAIQKKEQALDEAKLAGQITLEQQRSQLVELEGENLKRYADAQAYSLKASMEVLAGMDSKALETLASMDMNPSKLIALAFKDLSQNAEKVGQLNIAPDLLKELLYT